MIDSLLSLFFALMLVVLGYGKTPSPVSPQPATESAKFVRVVDGDTIKVQQDNKEETIRIIGINTPETVDPRKSVECFGKEASHFAKDFFASKSAELVLTKDLSQGELDKYGRWLRYVSVKGKDYGESAIGNGFAYEYTYNEPYALREKYKELEKAAQDNELGLWSPAACDE